MHILLTGGTGTVGSQLGKRLARLGHSITTLARNVEKAALALPFPSHVMKWDLEAPLRFDAPIDAVIHLAGESIATKPWSEKRKEELLHSRVDTTTHIIRSLERSQVKPKIWINASAVGFYGANTQGPVDESQNRGEGFLADLCAAWEKASAPVEEWGARRVLLRIGVVFAKRGGFLQELLPIFRFGAGGAIAGAMQHISWIHIDDLIDMIVFLPDA